MPIPSNIFETMNPQKYEDLRDQIQNGDLLFFSGPELPSKLIKWATKSPWSHVGFVLRLANINRIILFESVENAGIHSVVLSNVVNGYDKSIPPYKGKLLIARHADFAAVNNNELEAMVTFAVDRLGAPYALSEIIKISARITLGILFGAKNIPPSLQAEDEFICSEYVARCYQIIGIQIAWDNLGFIAPGDIANDPKVNPIGIIQTAGN